jgi:exopolysaccharide biosynthesis polyprenyl glycosylphosphotransferase
MNKRRLTFDYLLYDMLAALIVWVLFVAFRKIINDIQIFESIRFLIPNYNYIISLFFFPFYCVFVHYLSGFYLNPINKSKITEVFSTLISSAIIATSIFSVRMLKDVAVSYEYFYVSLLVLFGLLFVFTFCFRTLIGSRVRSNFKTKKWTINTIIIGTGNNALKIASEFEEHAEQNTLIGFVSTDKHVGVPANKVLGNLSQLDFVIEKFQIKECIVVLDNADDYQLFKIINTLYKFNVGIQFTPRLYEVLAGNVKINRLQISPLVSITSSSMSDWEVSMKRLFDIVISLLALLLVFPLLLYFTIIIKKNSKGPVFYRQERIGQFGRPFKILKFRTMYLGSERGVPRLSSADDKRITAVGRTLRKYRLDEIPQFWNILKGEMSIVGPRPERKYYINRIIGEAPYYCLLYKIRPGLTSWGPIKIGYSDTIEKMIERLNYDIIYMENMSLITDAKIILYTLEIILKGKGI